MCLQTTWFFLWGLLWAVYFITDGFDFGVGTLLPFMGKTEAEKRIMLNSIGPHWDGNEVWLITAGGVTFAAFPLVYATMFSSLYSGLMLILFALILRGVAIELRDQIDDQRWRMLWDACIFGGSLAPAILFGVTFANIFAGIPIDAEGIYHGNLFTLLNSYGLLGGILFLALFLMHGSLWLTIKTDGDLQERSARFAKVLWPWLLIVAAGFLVASYFDTPLYDNYLKRPLLFIVPLLAVVGLVGIKLFLKQEEYLKAWFASTLTILSATFFGIIGLFPNLFPSSINAKYSLTAFNASSSPLTLKIMLIVTIIFLPVVIAYQIWSYVLFKDKATADSHGDAY